MALLENSYLSNHLFIVKGTFKNTFLQRKARCSKVNLKNKNFWLIFISAMQSSRFEQDALRESKTLDLI